MLAEDDAGPPTASQANRPETVSKAGRAGTWRKLLTVLVAIYAVAVVGLWAWMYADGDHGILATLVLFGPRWLCAWPLPPLALGALVWRRALLAPLAALGVVLLFGVMGFQAHLPATGQAPVSLRVMTCNLNESGFREPLLSALVADQQPDVVALQEVKYGTAFNWPPGWHTLVSDKLVLASRWPIVKREFLGRRGHGSFAAARFSVQLPDREIQVFDVHLLTPRPGLEAMLSRTTLINPAGAATMREVLQERAAECQRVSDWVRQFPGEKIVMGDFNMPSESTLFRRYWSWLADAFGTRGWGLGFTKISQLGRWSYGARIDRVLFSPELRCVRSWVGPDVASDHLPLLAEFE